MAEKDKPLPTIRMGDLVINYDDREVTVSGRPIDLTATEFDLVAELSVNAGRVLTHRQLFRRVWGTRHVGDLGTLRTYVKRLRRKLGDTADNPTYIHTVPRLGYRMAKRG